MPTDLTFPTAQGRFNDRVCGLFIQDNRLLAMHDERSPYDYLPGGRVALHEPAEAAILREVREELGIESRIVRPLWAHQSFFDVSGERLHELCFYYLMEVGDLPQRGQRSRLCEGRHTHDFEWLPFERLRSEYFYPTFLKEQIFHLPEQLVLQTEWE